MTRYTRSTAHICSVLALASAFLTTQAPAQDRGRGWRSNTISTYEPIGFIAEQEFGGATVTINGRTANGDQAIWNGDLIEVPAGASAWVLVESIARITLPGGTRVRLSTALGATDGRPKQRTLIGSLASGEMSVQLQQGAEAYIEARGSKLAASGEALFRIATRGERAEIEVERGTVRNLNYQVTLIEATTVRIDPNGPIVEVPNEPLKVGRRKTKTDHQRWVKRQEPSIRRKVSFSFTDVAINPHFPAQSREAVRNRRVTFSLDPNTLGTLDKLTDTTDDNGVVSVSFTASDKTETTHIHATIDRNPLEDSPGVQINPYSRKVVVTPGFWTKNRILIVTAAVTAAVVCAIKCRPRDSGQLRSGPINIP